MDKLEQLYDILGFLDSIDYRIDDSSNSHFIAVAAGKLSIATRAIENLFKEELAEIKTKRNVEGKR